MYVFCWGQVVFPGVVAAAVPVRCGRMETLQKPMKNCLGVPKRYKIQRKITWVRYKIHRKITWVSQSGMKNHLGEPKRYETV